MRDEVNLKISGRIVLQLGDALISDEIMALSELIKNSYDADSNYVNIIIDAYCNEPYIKIIDDGCGMDLNTIKDGFLKIGTDIKEHEKISKKYKRITQGNKGIGRLSLNKLSKDVNVITVPEGTEKESCTHFDIDWQKFALASDVSNVNIEINESSKLYDTYFKDRIEDKHGTILNLNNVNNINFWKSNDTVKRIKEEVIALIDPYIEKEKSFNVYININGEEIILNDINFDVIANNANVTSTFKFINNMVNIDIIRNEKYINDRIDKELKRLKIEFPEFMVKIDRKKIFEKYREDSYHINICDMSSFPHLDKKLIVDEKLNYLPDDFYGKIYAFDYNAASLSKDEKNVIDAMSGVNLYRNGFRIFPYGKGNDWLDFTKYSQTIKSNIYRMHTVSGYVKIDGEKNLVRLKEMTNRKGIIEDNYGSNFLSIIKDIISRQLVYDDIKFRENFSIDIKKINELQVNGPVYDVLNDSSYVILRKKESLNSINKVLNDSNKQKDFDGNISISSVEFEKIVSGVNNVNSYTERIKKEASNRESMANELMGVIGSSLIAEKFAHEVLRNTDYIKKNSKMILGYSDETALKKFRNKVSIIFSKSKYLDKLASTLDKNSYSRRKEITDFELVSFLRMYIFENFSEIFIENNIQLIIENCDFYIKGSKEDILIAFENLIVNSLDWFDINNTNNRTIIIKANSENRTVEYYDNGIGIHKDVEETLFEPFVTLKPLSCSGRGIGLYIVKTLFLDNNAKIFLSDKKNSVGNCYKFIIDFSKED